MFLTCFRPCLPRIFTCTIHHTTVISTPYYITPQSCSHQTTSQHIHVRNKLHHNTANSYNYLHLQKEPADFASKFCALVIKQVSEGTQHTPRTRPKRNHRAPQTHPFPSYACDIQFTGMYVVV